MTKPVPILRRLRELAKDEDAYNELVDILLGNPPKRVFNSEQSNTIEIGYSHRLPANCDLTDTNQLAQIAAQFLPGGVLTIVDQDMIYRFVGGYNLARFGYDPAEMVGKSPYDFIPSDVVEEFVNGFKKSLSGEWAVGEIYFAKRAYVINHRPLYDATGQKVVACISVSQDITHYYNLQEELRASEERYRNVFEGSQAMVTLSSPKTLCFVDVNPTAAEFYGYTREELQGMPITQINMMDEDGLRNKMNEVFDSDKRYFQFKHRKKNGEVRDVELYTAVVNIDGEDLTYSIIHDITERIRIEQELRESQRMTRNITEAVPYMIFVYDITEGRNIFFNGQVPITLGYPWEELDKFGTTFILELVHPDDLEYTVAHFEMLIRKNTNDITINEFRIKHKNGQWRVLKSFDRIFDREENGDPKSIIGVMQDVTATRTIERALREYEARYRQVLKHLPNTAILMFDTEMRILLAEGALFERLGLHKKLLEDRLLSDAFPPEIFDAWYPYCKVAIHGNRMHRVSRLRGRYLDGNFVPIMDEEGNVSSAMAILYDVTENRKVAEQVFLYRMQREKMQLLSSFITNASHEFRTPLSIINSSVYLMERVEDKEALSRHARKIEAQVEQISSLVDSLALMTVLDASVGFVLAETNLQEVVEDVLTTLQPRIHAQNHHVNFEHNAKHIMVRADGNMIYRAILEILVNAIRFTPAGGEINIELQEDDEYVSLTVGDNGEGMSEEVKEHAFDRFYRADHMRTTAGFGLGLPIARAIIDRHRGMIDVESAPGDGSKFRVKLPYNPSDYNATDVALRDGVSDIDDLDD